MGGKNGVQSQIWLNTTFVKAAWPPAESVNLSQLQVSPLGSSGYDVTTHVYVEEQMCNTWRSHALAGGNAKWCHLFGKLFGSCFKR